MKKTRRKFTREFKIEAVRLVTEEGRGIAETGRELGVNPTVLSRWKDAIAKNGGQAFPGKGRLAPMAEEIRRLERELKRVSQERDFLKKATAFFARENR